jgi:hypothetical protein
VIVDFRDIRRTDAADYSTRVSANFRRPRAGYNNLLNCRDKACAAYCMRYCTMTLASAGLVVQPAAAVCTAMVSEAPAA